MAERDAQLRAGLFTHVYVRGHGASYLLTLPVQPPQLESAAGGAGEAGRFLRIAKAMPVPPLSVRDQCRDGEDTHFLGRGRLRRSGASFGLCADIVSGDHDRRAELLGWRLYGKPGHFPVDLPLQYARCGDRPHQSARPPGRAHYSCRHSQSHQ
ncbi:hypothetical protein D9M69_547610 [compost metagenome]